MDGLELLSLWKCLPWEGNEAVTDAAEGLVTGNHLPDSYMGGLLECNTDPGQGHIGSLAFGV